MSTDDKFKTRKSILILISIFVISLMAMFYVYLMFPELDEYDTHFLSLHFVLISFHLTWLFIEILGFFCGRSEKKHVKLPWDIEDAKKLGQVLDRYKDLYYFEVMSAVIIIYIL